MVANKIDFLITGQFDDLRIIDSIDFIAHHLDKFMDNSSM